jgi:hypothetical protein
MRYKIVGGDCHRTNQNLNIFISLLPMNNGAIAIAPYKAQYV